MATHSPPTREETPPAAARRAVVTTACLNAAFVVLLLGVVVGLSSLATAGDVQDSSAFPNNGGEQQPIGAGDARRLESHDDKRCAAGAGSDDAIDRRGYVDYLYLFHCVLGGRGALGYAAMTAWLAVLFYVLGDTAATYFCASLDGLARLLRLPPAIAGATLLSLGNGAPDALSTVAAFASASSGAGGTSTTAAAVVGLSGVLGGAMFVSSAVLGVIGLRLGGQGVAVDRASFFRDAGFLLLALAAVAVVLAVGEVNIWGAVAFTSLYIVYVLAVALTPDRWSGRHSAEVEHCEHAPTIGADFSELHNVAETKFFSDQEAQQEPLLLADDDDTAPLLQHYAGNDSDGGAKRRMARAFWTVVRALDFSLRLPRQLTIPDASSEERWNKPTAVTAATLAPILLSILCRHASGGSGSPLLAGILAGVSLGILAFLTTDPAAPPTRPLPLAAWLAGGFAMSVAWAYVAANEVVSLLSSAGAILFIDAAALGVTVLSWGNSLGDLVTNVAVASSSRGGGGGSGAQVAVSGCYGGPVFNVLVGLGLSMTLACWAGYPRPVKVPREAGLYRTLGFVAAGVLWAAVVLHRRGMRVDRTLGLGLLAVYLGFLCVNIWQLLGPNGRQ